VLVTGKDGECQTETEAGLQKRQQACRFCSPTGFVNFKKTKPLNLNMQAALGQAV
jgi:hypothetical protein